MANGAMLKPAGDLTAGVEVKGAVKQYLLDGTDDATSGLETITPYDSGAIVAANQPGTYEAVDRTNIGDGASEKLTDGTIQRASVILSSADAGYVGDALVSSYSVQDTTVVGSGLPVAPAGSTAADGLSQAPQHE